MLSLSLTHSRKHFTSKQRARQQSWISLRPATSSHLSPQCHSWSRQANRFPQHEKRQSSAEGRPSSCACLLPGLPCLDNLTTLRRQLQRELCSKMLSPQPTQATKQARHDSQRLRSTCRERPSNLQRSHNHQG